MMEPMEPWAPSPIIEVEENRFNRDPSTSQGGEIGIGIELSSSTPPAESVTPRFTRHKSTVSDCIGGERKRFHQFDKEQVEEGRRRRTNSSSGRWGNQGLALPRSATLNKGVAGLRRMGTSFGARVHRVFSEDYQQGMWEVRDPKSTFVQRWNSFFIVCCLLAVWIDPFFYFLPAADTGNACIYIQNNFAVGVTFLRTVMDLIFLLHIILQFRIAYVAPSSRVFGREDLVVDKREVAIHYLKKGFILDVIAVIPIPQTVMWIIIPAMHGSPAKNTKNFLRLLVLIQFIPRVWRIFPLMSTMRQPNGAVFDTAWSGIVCNLAVYMIASHITGACWYLLTIERVDTCWRQRCKPPQCDDNLLDCGFQKARGQSVPSDLINACFPSYGEGSATEFDYGIYDEGVANMLKEGATAKYFYSLWWALRNVSSLGSNLQASSFIGEVLFCITISIIGLLLLALLVGNMQTYLLSLTRKLEEMRVHRRDIEQWLRHRQLPKELKDRVRRFEHFSWATTRGVDEEERIRELPPELQRDIKRHLCLDLMREVQLFKDMDEQLLDAICVLIRPTIFIEDSTIIREGDPVQFMLFIIRGNLESATTNGGRTGFLSTGSLNPGDFCGEELLTWCLDPRRREHLPTSTRTIRALVNVEAFSLAATDLKYVASQFKKLHRKEFMRTLRYHSLQWRTWAACSIQAAWRRKKKRDLKSKQVIRQTAMQDMNLSFRTALYVTRFASNLMKSVKRARCRAIAPLVKPEDPDEDEAGVYNEIDDITMDLTGAVPKSGFLGSGVAKSGLLHSTVPKSGMLVSTVPKSGLLMSPVPSAGMLRSSIPSSGMLRSKPMTVPKSGFL